MVNLQAVISDCLDHAFRLHVYVVYVMEDTDEIFDDCHVPEIREHAIHSQVNIFPQDAEGKVIVHGLKELTENDCLGVKGELATTVNQSTNDDLRPHPFWNVLVEIVTS